MIIVADASPLIAVAHLELGPAFMRVFNRVLAPESVMEEVARPRFRFRGALAASFPGIEVVHTPVIPAVVKALDLDAGETDAIAIALERRAAALLVDDRDARVASTRLGLRVIGTAGVLIELKRCGEIVMVRPCLNRLRSELNFFLSDALYRHVLQLTREG